MNRKKLVWILLVVAIATSGVLPVAPVYATQEDTQALEILMEDATDNVSVLTGRLPGCPPARVEELRSPTTFAVKGPAIVHLWWPHGRTPWARATIKALINARTRETFFRAQGNVYIYANNVACRHNLKFEIADDPFTRISLLRLERLKLAQRAN